MTARTSASTGSCSPTARSCVRSPRCFGRRCGPITRGRSRGRSKDWSRTRSSAWRRPREPLRILEATAADAYRADGRRAGRDADRKLVAPEPGAKTTFVARDLDPRDAAVRAAGAGILDAGVALDEERQGGL